MSEDGDARDERLDSYQRQVLLNQNRILEALYPREASVYRQAQRVLEAGYSLHYDEVLGGLSPEMKRADQLEVLDVLDLYRTLNYSYRELHDKAAVKVEELEFRGFDGNNESDRFGYTRFLIVELKRYSELRGSSDAPSFNSHMPMSNKYRRMVALWRSLDVDRPLTSAEINRILGA